MRSGVPKARWLVLVGLFLAVPLARAADEEPPERLSTLTEVSVQPSSEVVTVVLTGSRAPDFTSFTMDEPFRVVVDWAGSTLHSDLPRERRYDDGLVRRVAVRQFASEAERISRVVVDVARRTTYQVEAEGSRILVRLTPVESPGPAPGVEAPAEEAEAEAAALPAAPEPPPELAQGPLTEPAVEIPVAPPPVPTPVVPESPEPEPLPSVAIAPEPEPSANDPVPEREPDPPPNREPDPAPVATEDPPSAEPEPALEPEPAPEPEPEPPEPVRLATFRPPPPPPPVPVVPPPTTPSVPAPPRTTRPIAASAAPPSTPSPPAPPDDLDTGWKPPGVGRGAPKPLPIVKLQAGASEPVPSPSPAEADAEDDLAPVPTRAGPVPVVREVPPAATDEPPAQPGPYVMRYIGFKQSGGVSRVFVRLDKRARYTARVEGDLFVLELRRTSIPLATNRLPLDTSYFDSPVERVHAKLVGPDTRVEVKLREQVTPRVKRIGTTIAIDFPGS